MLSTAPAGSRTASGRARLHPCLRGTSFCPSLLAPSPATTASLDVSAPLLCDPTLRLTTRPPAPATCAPARTTLRTSPLDPLRRGCGCGWFAPPSAGPRCAQSHVQPSTARTHCSAPRLSHGPCATQTCYRCRSLRRQSDPRTVWCSASAGTSRPTLAAAVVAVVHMAVVLPCCSQEPPPPPPPPSSPRASSVVLRHPLCTVLPQLLELLLLQPAFQSCPLHPFLPHHHCPPAAAGVTGVRTARALPCFSALLLPPPRPLHLTSAVHWHSVCDVLRAMGRQRLVHAQLHARRGCWGAFPAVCAHLLLLKSCHGE
eukprot:scaffold109989_cov15-Tisochrysis_lutea.AAC.2